MARQGQQWFWSKIEFKVATGEWNPLHDVRMIHNTCITEHVRSMYCGGMYRSGIPN